MVDVNSKYEKIHFYLADDAYNTIDNFNELQLAVEDVQVAQATYSVAGNDRDASSDSEEYLSLTVEFESNFFNTEEYSDKFVIFAT